MGLHVMTLVRLIAGSNWDDSSSCSSRAVNGTNLSSNRNANNGGRLASVTRDIFETHPSPQICVWLNPRLNMQALSFDKIHNREDIAVSTLFISFGKMLFTIIYEEI